MYEIVISIDTFTPVVIPLEEVKSYCRADNDQDDAMLINLVKSSQEEALGFTHSIFGSAVITEVVFGTPSVIALPYTPVLSIDSFELDGVASTDYELKGSKLVITTSGFERVDLTYSAQGPMPEDVKTAILQRTKFAYDYPDDMKYEVPRFFERILTRYRTVNSW